MCDGTDEQCEVWRSSWRRARKRHGCITCGEGIRKGDLYRYCFYVFDGMSGDHATCARCDDLYIAVSRRADQCGIYPTYLCPELDCDEDWRMAFGEDPPEEVQALAFMTREEIQALAQRKAGTPGV